MLHGDTADSSQNLVKTQPRTLPEIYLHYFPIIPPA